VVGLTAPIKIGIKRKHYSPIKLLPLSKLLKLTVKSRTAVRLYDIFSLS